MGNSEESKSSKPEKSPPPATDQSNIHMYPDWAAMQAYYGPRVAVPPPYFNPAVASGHPHPYMWGPPQSMMPPYGAPYAAVYAHGGVYPHPGVPLGSAPLSVDSTAKSSGNSDQSLVKRLKEFDGLAMSIGNGNADSAEGRGNHELSQSCEETEGSSDSNGDNPEAVQNGKKRSREGSPINSGDGKGKSKSSAAVTMEMNGAADKVVGMTVAPVNKGEKAAGTVFSPNMTTALELRNPSGSNVKTNPANGQPCLPNEPWLQNERELKRERRKQSNRESARRSRLRKQAEADELAMRVQLLTAENTSLKSEISKLTENSEKLRLENAALMEKMEEARLGQQEEVDMAKIDDQRLQPVGTADLLARVNNSGSTDENNEEDEASKNKNSGAKLYPLLSSSRSDTVAAG